jgi:hypothetical protein
VHPGAEITSADYEFSCTPETSSRALPVSICMHLSELMSSWTYYEQADYHIMALPINAKFKHQTCNN